ncbi:hypothetical protein GCM10023405_19960 [Streptomonospora salina]
MKPNPGRIPERSGADALSAGEAGGRAAGLAYCTALGIEEGHIVYAAGAQPTVRIVRESGVRLRIRALDSSLPRHQTR